MINIYRYLWKILGLEVCKSQGGVLFEANVFLYQIARPLKQIKRLRDLIIKYVIYFTGI